MADRPPFILVFAADQQGCGFHRCMMPLASLVEAGVADGRLDITVWPDEAAEACKPDVIVWQRQVEDAQIETMARWRKMLPDALFIYELDDYLDDIPAASFHASFMPLNITDRITKALVHCDRVSTTTDAMATWLRSMTPMNKRIDVVPNALPVARLRERSARTTGKLRVGFAGGISHAGDLGVLRHAMETIGDEVTWVFFGMAIEDPPVTIEYHDGVPVTLYLDKMASLDLDLMLAPLSDHPFNQCKSNLRLVEAAAIGAPVVAQDIAPYHVNKPSVFAYATTPENWAAAIQKFIAASRSERQRSADSLRTWAGRHYTLEKILPARMHAWLPEPKEGKPWRPAAVPVERRERVLVACNDAIDVRERFSCLAPIRKVTEGLERACRVALSMGADVVWLRATTTFDDASYERMMKLLNSGADIASVTPLATDGANGFPQAENWTPLPASVVLVLGKLAADYFGDKALWTGTSSGPVVILSVRALAMLGIPDVTGCEGNEEQALLEWGLRASTRGWKHGQALGAFAGSTTPPAQPSHLTRLRLHARGLSEYLREKPEATLPNEDRAYLEMKLLQSQWGGPRPGSMGFANDYAAWSMLRRVQENRSDPHGLPIHPVVVREFGAEKDWPDDAYVVFIDENVSLGSAVFWFEDAITWMHRRSPLVMYGDNDTVVAGKASPEFKPDFDPTLFLAQDYVTPVCAVHASLLFKVPANRTELYTIALNVFVDHGTKVFHHIPRILGSVDINTEPEAIALETLERQLAIQDVFGKTVKVEASRHIIGCLTVRQVWKAKIHEAPLVSIIVPTLGSGRLIQPCVATILQHTAYPNYEVIVVQNGDKRAEPELAQVVLDDPRVRVVHYEEPFSWSKINNWAIRIHAKGDYLITLNDDVCIGAKNWLDDMMGHAVWPDVGAVGAKLVHPAGFIQHVGVVCHNGIAGHMHKGTPNGQAGHTGRALLSHEAVAVTGACMLFSRANFDDVNGFNTALSYNYNDTVFCVTLHKRGKRNVVEMAAELLHPEASSRPESSTPEGMAILLNDNAKLSRMCPDPDPYWNPNMSLAVSVNGQEIHGMNADVLAWTDFVPNKDSMKVLLVNDKPGDQGMILDVLREGDVPFLADLSGFSLSLIAPQPLNIKPWDIRDSSRMAEELKRLGIDRIILRSLIGVNGAAPPVEALRTINTQQLGIPVQVQPLDTASVAPWLVEDGRANEQKTFGYVDMAAWKAAYEAATAA